MEYDDVNYHEENEDIDLSGYEVVEDEEDLEQDENNTIFHRHGIDHECQKCSSGCNYCLLG